MRRLDRAWFERGDLEGLLDGYHGLACAVLKQAARDSVDPDVSEIRRLDARLFLVGDGLLWFDALGIDIGADNLLRVFCHPGKIKSLLEKAET